MVLLGDRTHRKDTELESYYYDESVTIYHGNSLELMPHLGPVEHVICDPPYDERTHNGATYHNRYDNVPLWENGLGYEHWSNEVIAECLVTAERINAGWFAVFISHHQYPVYEEALAALGYYVFSLVPCVIRGQNVRLAGDGPSNWAAWLLVARPKRLHKWGTLPGGYSGNSEPGLVKGHKPEWLMLHVIADYSRRGERILDPCIGSGTTLAMAKYLGRRAIGMDISEECCEIAAKRCEKTRTQEALGFS